MICTIGCAHYARPARVPKDMQELIRLFVEIALLRRGPQDVPSSALLLVLTVLGYLAVTLVLSAVLIPVRGWVAQLLVATLFTLVWYGVLLRVVRRPERTLQTTTAVFGFQAVLAPLSVGFEWLVRRYINDATWQAPVTCAGLLWLAWLIAANSHIVKSALEWSGTASVALVILQMVFCGLLLLTLFPPIQA
jgi:hypothetical protein